MGRDYIAQHRLYLNSKGDLCAATDPDVSTLLAAEGGSVPLERAIALGLVADTPAARGVESEIGVSSDHRLFGAFSAGAEPTPAADSEPGSEPTPELPQEPASDLPPESPQTTAPVESPADLFTTGGDGNDTPSPVNTTTVPVSPSLDTSKDFPSRGKTRRHT